MHLHSAPTGRSLIARGVSPWTKRGDWPLAPRGRHSDGERTAAPLGLTAVNADKHQGLTPLAIDDRRFAAAMHAIA
jgi:hypothetical protein